MTTGTPKKPLWRRAAELLVLMAVGYFVGVGVAAAFGSPEPWNGGIVGIGPAVVGYFAGTPGRRPRSS